MTVSASLILSDFPLLETKLYRPKWSADLVSRPRLIERIHPPQKLTLVSAPAGFGKTTLLAEWIATVPAKSAAWVSLDQGDNVLAVFWRYLITALQKIQPSLGERSLSLLRSSQPPSIESILMMLLNELTAVETDIVLILDDYHTIETPAIHDSIVFFLRHLPPQVHLIIASRVDPPLSLARLRSHGDLTELRVSDLRFTPDEAAAFLKLVMGMAISAAAVSALEQRTDGWIAGLQLAALSMQGREDISDFVEAFSGNDRYIVDYLMEEVLQRQPDRVRHFLLQTAILERLSGSLCDALCGDFIDQSDGQKMLETLERGNLFIMPLDNKRQWYRYHHLFADVLQAYALREWPERMSNLHQRASKWYEQNSLFSDAIRHALAAKDFERAVDLIEQVWPDMRNCQQEATVLGWIKALPDPLVRTRPALSVAYALVLLNAGQLDAVEASLQDAERALAESAAAAQDAKHYRSLPASIANTRAFRAQALGDFAGTIAYAQQALTLLPSEEDNERGVTSAFLGLAYWTSGDVAAAYQSFAEGLRIFQTVGNIQIAICATSVLAQMGLAQGWLQAAIATCEQALHLAAQQPVPILQGTSDLHLALSELHYEQGDLDTAYALLEKGEVLRKNGSTSGADYLWWRIKAQLTAAQGDLDTALSQLQEAERLYRRSPLPNIRPIEALKVRWWLQQGRLAEALSWVKKCGLSVNDPPDYLREYEHLTLARVLLAQDKQDEASEVIEQVIGLLNQLLAAAKAKARTGSMIKILTLLALAEKRQDNSAAAILSLERALILAKPEGHVRIFADCGLPMAQLLQQAMTQSVTPTYTQQLLTALEHWGQKPYAPKSPSPQPLLTIQNLKSKIQNQPTPSPSQEGDRSSPTPQPLLDPLSQRELDVLRLLNTELSGPEIAREMVVALSTVRTHTKHIYSKLNVTNRRAAVKRAVELGLI
ncbi:MAG: LuxR C-terminal-related transcriptional regulator [Cyanobacteria bacterium P01_F01_bin.150]